MAKYVKKELFDPLGIRISSCRWEDRFDKLAAAGHDHRGRVKPNRPLYRRANSAYTLYCTPHDYAKFLVEIMKQDRSAKHSLSTRSIDAMLTRTVKLPKGKPIRRAGKPLPDAVYWGLGWGINKTANGDHIYHSGSNEAGFRCYCEFDRKQGTGIVIMTNSMSGGKLWHAVIRAVSPP